MRLYVCWGTFPVPWPRIERSWRPGDHPCKIANDALTEAGHSPTVVRSYGLASLPDITRGRREVKRLTGESWVPVLVLGDGEVINGSANIVAWAQEHPAANGASGGRPQAPDDGDFMPALRFHRLTPLFDIVAAATVRDRAIKSRVLARAKIASGEDVLDLGCGTGTLAIAAGRATPGARLTGLDADPAILRRARSKATSAGVGIRFDEGMSTALPYADDSFDLVLSTLFFHHLPDDAKRETAHEISRVLRPGGRLVVGDVGRPHDLVMRLAVRLTVQLLDGVATTALNVGGGLPRVLSAAGLRETTVHERVRTPTGTYEVLTARAG